MGVMRSASRVASGVMRLIYERDALSRMLAGYLNIYKRQRTELYLENS